MARCSTANTEILLFPCVYFLIGDPFCSLSRAVMRDSRFPVHLVTLWDSRRWCQDSRAGIKVGWIRMTDLSLNAIMLWALRSAGILLHAVCDSSQLNSLSKVAKGLFACFKFPKAWMARSCRLQSLKLKSRWSKRFFKVCSVTPFMSPA